MPFAKGQSGNPAGRVQGQLNKTTRAARLAIATAAEGLGGAQRLVAWAKEDPANEKAFWTSIYTKLTGASGTDDDPFTTAKKGGMDCVYEQLQASAHREADSGDGG